MTSARNPHRILVVEDDTALREELCEVLKDAGYCAMPAASAAEAERLVRATPVSLAVTDLMLPDAGGMDIVKRVRTILPECPVLVMTAHASVDAAVEAMRLGAFHYLQKPVSLITLQAEVEKALEHATVLRERSHLRRALSAEHGVDRIIGASPAMAALRQQVLEFASADQTCLVSGETGTGKELVAEALHYEGARAGAPLVKVNCAALSESLLESELFGHEKGAFTGADRRRKGRFERADGGTLFLDEISEMGLGVQAKLLRVLQGEPFERVGGDDVLRPDVRVVAATNRLPSEAVAEGRIRKDLYYRLNVVQIAVPPLRDRREDVQTLAEAFLMRFADEAAKRLDGFSSEALGVLQQHDWPGNVRELENCIDRAVVVARGVHVERDDLPPPLSEAADPGPGPEDTLDLDEVEKRTILRALDVTGWNKVHAAEVLGIYPSSLYKKLKRLGIPLKPPR
jgi:two-component system response regulator HydG